MSAAIKHSDADGIITLDESRDLTHLENIIERGLDTFVEVGKALAEIRDRRLYRIEHKTFEAYCRDKWNMGRAYAHRLMVAAETVEMLPMGDKPQSERQTRPLTKLPKEKRAEAWQKAVEASPTGQPTPKEVEAAVQSAEVTPKPEQSPVAPRVKIDAADRIWAVAKGHLDKIIDKDESLDRVLDEVIAYCEKRKSASSVRRLKKCEGKVRRLTFTLYGKLLEAVPWKDDDPYHDPKIIAFVESKAHLTRLLKWSKPTALANKVWDASRDNTEVSK